MQSEDDAFREEVRAFLRERFDADLRAAARVQAGVFAEPELSRRWHKILYAQGWAAPSWPVEHGGPGWSRRQCDIFVEECTRAGAPILPAMGIDMCAPVIMRFGTPDQQAFFLPRLLSGEHRWCQGYSEPQAGSDLASLRTRAERDGDVYIVNGSKIWTTHAHDANWIFLLARTSTEGPKQTGITFLLSPMDASGITVRPIISISGEHEVNEVFFDNVRIPIANRIGGENDGWNIAKYLLEFERGGGSIGAALLVALDRLKEILAAELCNSGEPLIDDPRIAQKLLDLEIAVLAADATDKRLSASGDAGHSVGNAAASVKKLLASELGQQISAFAMDALGPYAIADQRAAIGISGTDAPIGPEHGRTLVAKYLNGRASTIFGGSSEVQRNILAKHILNT